MPYESWWRIVVREAGVCGSRGVEDASTTRPMQRETPMHVIVMRQEQGRSKNELRQECLPGWHELADDVSKRSRYNR